MPSISKKDVAHIAKLARLALTSKEQSQLVKELGSVVAYVQQLGAVNTEDVSATHQVTGLMNVLREDVPVQQTIEVREQLLNAAPDRVGDYIRGKAVFQ